MGFHSNPARQTKARFERIEANPRARVEICPIVRKPLPATGFRANELILVGDGYERTSGGPLSTLLSLPANWPES
jgi:hypothetical protein